MAFGLQFEQHMEGAFYWVHEPGREYPASIELRVGVGNVFRLPFGPRAELDGTLHAPGLAGPEAPVHGHLHVHGDQPGRLLVDLHFAGEPGEPLRLHGDLVFEAAQPVQSLTRFAGSVFQGETEIARLILRAPPRRELRRLLRSLRRR
jgi:hypothetical protein